MFDLRLRKRIALLDWCLILVTVCNVGVVLTDPPNATQGEFEVPRNLCWLAEREPTGTGAEELR